MRIVMKFGGTSVGDGARIVATAQLAAAEQARGNQVAVVVSAMSGVTNALISMARRAASGDADSATEVKRSLLEQHVEAAQTAVRDATVRAILIAQCERALADLENLGRAVAALGEVTPRALDTISAFGERLIVPFVAQAVRESGSASEAVDGSELIVTNAQFGAAHPHMAETTARTQARLLPLLQRGVLPVITGFIGATHDGRVTTLGRGGSDYSATILGAALEADEVWIWTDVDGVMSADPRVVPEARTLAEISYAEAAELAYFGAKVLHPKTIRPAADKDLPVRILNSFAPDRPGTRIVRAPRENGQTVKAISAIRDLSIVTVEGRGMIGVPGVAARVFTTVAHEGISVLMISQSSSEQNICLVIESDAAERAVAALETAFALERMQESIERIAAQGQTAIIAIVGAGMKGTPGIAARVFGALAERRINVIAVAQGSSEYNLSVVIAEGDANDAVRAIHNAFQAME